MNCLVSSIPEEARAAIVAARGTAYVLVARRAGSVSFGLDLPESDVDWSVVWAPPMAAVLGASAVVRTLDGKSPDWVARELSHWCRLLLKGNPSIVEDALDPGADVSPMFAPVASCIRRFVSKRTVEAYLGYARAQLHLLERGKGLHTTGGCWNPKFGVHLLRLLHEGVRLSKGVLPAVRLPDDERDALMLVRRGRVERDEVVGRAVDMAQAIEEARPWPWPDEPDAAVMDDACAEVRWLLERADRSGAPSLAECLIRGRDA